MDQTRLGEQNTGRLTMKQIAILLALAAILVGQQAAPAEAADVKLTELIVAKNLRAGVPYDAALRFEMTGNPRVEKVCFLWSGEGPYCWKDFRVSKWNHKITTRARTGNPNRYTLTAFVEYRNGDEKKESNRVSAAIDVR